MYKPMISVSCISCIHWYSIMPPLNVCIDQQRSFFTGHFAIFPARRRIEGLNLARSKNEENQGAKSENTRRDKKHQSVWYCVSSGASFHLTMSSKHKYNNNYIELKNKNKFETSLKMYRIRLCYGSLVSTLILFQGFWQCFKSF